MGRIEDIVADVQKAIDTVIHRLMGRKLAPVKVPASRRR